MRNATPVLLALTTAVTMAIGQTMFKIGSAGLSGNTPAQLGMSFLRNPILVGAIALYAATILVWIYVLKHLSLSTAYPLTAVSYVIVPIISYFVLKETVGLRVIIGSALIIAGVVVTHFKTA